MKLETISTKGEMVSVKTVTVQHNLSKKILATQTEPLGTTLLKTKQDLAAAMCAQILSGGLARFSIHDDANEEQIIVSVTAFVIPPEKMRPPKPELVVPDKRLVVPA